MGFDLILQRIAVTPGDLRGATATTVCLRIAWYKTRRSNCVQVTSCSSADDVGIVGGSDDADSPGCTAKCITQALSEEEEVVAEDGELAGYDSSDAARCAGQDDVLAVGWHGSGFVWRVEKRGLLAGMYRSEAGRREGEGRRGSACGGGHLGEENGSLAPSCTLRFEDGHWRTCRPRTRQSASDL